MENHRVGITKGNIRDWFELFRVFSWPCVLLPAVLGGLFAYQKDAFAFTNFIFLLFGVFLIHIAITIVNEYYDVKYKIDTLEQNKPSKVLVEERVSPEFALKISYILLVSAAVLVSLYSIISGFWGVLIFAALGMASGYFYTAPPVYLKYRGLGLPANFITYGLLLPQAILYGLSGSSYPAGLGLSLPLSFLISAILWANNMRDIEADKEIITLVGLLGLKKSFYIYLILLFSPYLLAVYYFSQGRISALVGLVLLTLPLALWLGYQALKGVKGQRDSLTFLDEKTAVLMLTFNFFWLLAYFGNLLT